MSPEQARGKRVDRRADIWAFGVVVYEMLTRRRAFEAEDISLTLAEVMTPDPECLDARATVAWALNKMEVGGFRHVPATEEHGQPRMVVSVRDIVAYLVAAFPEEILNLPPEFGTARYRERDGA